MAAKAQSMLGPLGDMFGDILTRLEALEAKVGVSPSGVSGQVSKGAPSGSAALTVGSGGGEAPAVKAYDAYVKTSLVPFVNTCDDLKGLKETGSLIKKAWDDVRAIIVLASRSKAPTNVAEELAPFLAPTQETVKNINSVRVDRDFDRHMKAITEMLACLSWILLKPPQQLPGSFVKEAMGSAEFWTNRIRKDFKGKNDTQIAFCDNLKTVMTGLVAYIEEYHKAGLNWNPKGVSVAEAAIRLTDEASSTPEDPMDTSARKRHPTLKGGPAVANVGGLIAELGQRKNADGTSAATGLRKVTKDQQTWRKEYNKEGGSAPAKAAAEAPAKKVVAKKKAPLRGIPIFEYQERGFKWIVENHTDETAQKEVSPNGVITIEITDPKQQVYLYNCDGVTVKVVGKFKSLVIDTCTKTAVVYETLISSAEMVNCKKIQLQVTGICPVFTIDKTVGLVVYLSKESADISTFTTSLSSEMNVSYPDGDDQKEIPIPEQFVHKVGSGSMKSEVSDLYH
ncbi:hypothetical protein ACA910_017795 [Epithemia clementina (nom. ined.)]